MIVQCPNCDTKYNLPSDKFKAGAKMKCSSCKHVFAMGAAAEEEEPQFEDLLDDEFGDEGEAAPAKEKKASPPPKEDDDDDDFSLDDLDNAGGGKSKAKKKDADDDADDDGFSLDDLDSPKKKKKGGGGLGGKIPKVDLGGKKKKILIAVVLLAVLGGAGYYFAGPMLLSPESAEEMAEEEAMEMAEEMTEEMIEDRGPVEEDVIATDNIRDLMLQSIKQYSVRNEKSGQIFVVEGKVVNNFPTPKELIKVEASLFDDTGVAVATKKQYCGASLALYELQLKSPEEIERALNSKENIAINNTNIPPGGEVEFMVVFYEPPPTVREFGIRVIEAKEPPN
jgi:predicted Zn finger-like uncharacterized protein